MNCLWIPYRIPYQHARPTNIYKNPNVQNRKNVTLKKYCHLDIDLSIRKIHRPYEFHIEALCIQICFALSRVIVNQGDTNESHSKAKYSTKYKIASYLQRHMTM